MYSSAPETEEVLIGRWPVTYETFIPPFLSSIGLLIVCLDFSLDGGA
jgi:hypothetical protein